MSDIGAANREAHNQAISRACGELDRAIRRQRDLYERIVGADQAAESVEKEAKESTPPLSVLLDSLEERLMGYRDRILKQTDEMEAALF